MVVLYFLCVEMVLEDQENFWAETLDAECCSKSSIYPQP